jgi:O-antigen ligase
VSALKMFQDKPFFGIGTNLFRFQCNKPEYKYKTRSCNAHPHNFYIQIMAELGLVGLSFLILFFLFLSKFLLQQLMLNNKSPIKKELQPDFLLYP